MQLTVSLAPENFLDILHSMLQLQRNYLMLLSAHFLSQLETKSERKNEMQQLNTERNRCHTKNLTSSKTSCIPSSRT
uniref:Uncharacterized protein n=1 Tax=Onchocerca volvulus TaxID=6282 RepID=A0A8R1TKE6_ONCVO